MLLSIKSEPKMARAICRAGKIALVLLATVGVSNVYADDGGSTNDPPATFVSQPFPLNRIPTSLAETASGNLSSWADLDNAVAAGFNQSADSLMILYPPGNCMIIQDCGLYTFDTNGEIAANIGLFQSTSAMGVSLWKMGVIETQLTTRAWVYMGTSDGTNSVAFRTNSTPAGFDPQAWVRSAYGDPPSYLTNDDLVQWYADRDRSRALLGMTLISADDLQALQAALQAAQSNATNAPGTTPSLPANTNCLSFVGIAGLSADGRVGLWIYSPLNNLPVDVFTRTTLMTNTPWCLIGTVNATTPFTLWYAPPGTDATGFFTCARADVDSDGDGIPDDREILLFGTNPYKWDSAGTSLGDYARYFIYGLSATNHDSNGDGMDDDEAILAGLNPTVSNTVAGVTSIRYYYDADDRVAGTFSSSPAGAVRYRISPAGNPASTAERSMP